MVVTLVVNFLLQSTWWAVLPDLPRYFVAFIPTAVPTCLLGFILYRTVDVPGISIGRLVIRRLKIAHGTYTAEL
jgi:hypothetical protein